MWPVNARFFGAWLLDSFESQRPDGTVSRPWGDDPQGIIYWDASGYFAVQLGPRALARPGDYISFFGTAQAPDGDTGTIVLRVTASSAPERITGDQVRDFCFLEAGLLRLRPPAGPDGSQSTFTWRRTGTSGG
jgi:hypothetical protein